jgi:uncharacterized membrane protein
MPDHHDIPKHCAAINADEKHSIIYLASCRWLVVFLLIIALGLSARLLHITRESVWWDEFATAAFLEPPQSYVESPDYERWNQQVIRHSSPTLGAFLAQNRLVDPAAMPLYLSMEYYWNTYISQSVVSLRLMSVFISMGVLVFVFLLGRKMFNTNAGLIAMLCIALSPIHVQFSKEIRMYGLMTLLAAALVYIFYHLYEDRGKRWWGLYAIVALLLSWTHPFALLLPFSLGVFWLTVNPRDLRRLFAWSMLNAAVLLPAAIYVLSIQFWGEDSTSGWMRLPSISEFFADILADDAIGMTYQVNATPDLWEMVVGVESARYILSWRWVAGRFMMVLALAALAWLFIAAYRNYAKASEASTKTITSAATLRWAYLLLLWLILPPLVLYGMSLFWRPCIMPRYTVHCSLALYLMMGGAISLVPVRMLRIAAVTLVCLFYGYQQTLMAGEAQHPDWYGARDHIRATASENELILVHNWLWKRVFAYNMGPSPHIVGYGSSHDILAEQCAFWLLHQRDFHGIKTPALWVVIRTDYFEKGPILSFEHELAVRGLQYESREFGGIQHVLVYRVQMDSRQDPVLNPNLHFTGEAAKEFSDLALEYWREGRYETAVALAGYANQIDPDYARAWSYKGMAYKELGQMEEALESLQKAVAIDRLDYPWSHINIAMLLVDLERYEEALNAALRALEVLPEDAWGYAMLGRAHFGLGEYEDALNFLKKAVTLNPGDLRIQQMLQDAESAVAPARDRNDE